MRTNMGASDLEIRRLIVETWSEVLSREVVEMDRSFFELGGDSFLATLVVGALADELNIELAVTDMYAHQTIELLSKHIQSMTAS
jgi:acyl carrier protein